MALRHSRMVEIPQPVAAHADALHDVDRSRVGGRGEGDDDALQAQLLEGMDEPPPRSIPEGIEPVGFNPIG